MAAPDSQIDEQLAADIDARAVAHLKELLIPKIQRECDIQEASIAAAWQSIQDSITALSRKKQIIFTTLKTQESEDRAHRVFDDDVWNMMPPTYLKIQDALQDRRKADLLPSPVVSPRPNKSDDFDRRSFTYDAIPSDTHDSVLLPTRPARLDGLPDTSAYAEPSPTTPSKRKSNLAPVTPGSPQKKARQSNICQQNATECHEHTSGPKPTIKLPESRFVKYWDIEGRDYIFKDPRVGDDWLCIQCNWSDYLDTVRFVHHPQEPGGALEHFRKKTAKCHDTSRNYTWDDILREYAFRVLDADLDEEMVKNNNEVTRELAHKTPKGKGKAKTKKMGFSAANRAPLDPTYVPEADMGINDVSTEHPYQNRNPGADNISEEDKIANEDLEEVLQSW